MKIEKGSTNPGSSMQFPPFTISFFPNLRKLGFVVETLRITTKWKSP